jgi:hypothetical protein
LTGRFSVIDPSAPSVQHETMRNVLIALTLAVLATACTESVAVIPVAFASEGDMTREAADTWCQERGAEVISVDDLDLAIETCGDVLYGWCWIDVPDRTNYVVTLDGALIDVGTTMDAPVVCIVR